MQQSIMNWYRYRNNVRKRSQQNLWQYLLRSLSSGKDPSTSPRPLPPWQLYMSIEHEAIVAELAERHPEMERRDLTRNIHLRADLAREMFKELDIELQEEYQMEADSLHNEEMAQWYQEQQKTGKHTDVDISA